MESLEFDDLNALLLGYGSETVLLSNSGHGGKEAVIAFEARVVAAMEVVVARNNMRRRRTKKEQPHVVHGE